MYVTHKEEDQDFWKKYNKSEGAEKKEMMTEFKAKMKAKKEDSGVQVKHEGPEKKKQIIVLENKIKQAFCTQAGMTKSQIYNMFESCNPK